MKKVRNDKGITLITLAITIVVMLILTISITSSMTSTIELKKYNSIKEDIIALTEEVKLYYLNNGELPVYEDGSLEKLPLTDEELARDINPNDDGKYYYIDSNKLPSIELNCGEGNKTKNFNTKDIYAVNEKSMTIYYLDGAVLDGEKHYTIVDDFTSGAFAEDYYSKAQLPIISVVTMEGNGKDKNLVASGDIVTLKILSNYEFSTAPTVKINNTNVEVTWDGTVGTATYEIPFETDNIDYNEPVTFSISDYIADNRAGDTITEPTFGKKVSRYAETLVQAFNKGNIKVGDYVNYQNPTKVQMIGEGYTDTGYTSPGTKTGMSTKNGYEEDINQTYSLTNNGKQVNWRVLGLSEDKKHLMLTTGSPLQKDYNTSLPIDYYVNYNNPYFFLDGAEGWIYGIRELDKICAIYKNDYADEVRSLNIDDINKLCKVSPKIEERAVYNSSNNNIDLNGNIGTTINYRYQYASPEDYLDGKTSDFSKTSDNYAYYGENAIDKNSSLYDILFAHTGQDYPDKRSYWLASRGISAWSMYFDFCLGGVHYAIAESCSNNLLNSMGGEGSSYDAIRPLVYLKSKITVNDIQKIDKPTAGEESWNY